MASPTRDLSRFSLILSTAGFLALLLSCSLDSVPASALLTDAPPTNAEQDAFTLKAFPTSLSINQWSGGQATIAVNNVSGNVNLSVSGLPGGIVASFTPVKDGVSTLTIRATGDLQPGPATVTIAGSTENVSTTTTLSLSLVELPVLRDENGYCNPSGSWMGLRSDGYAQLPQTCFYTALPATPSPGKVTALASGGDLQAALNAADCGDTITLQAGASFPLMSSALQSKGCDDQNWITVRTSAPDSALPPEQTRINPSYAGVHSLPSRPPFSGGSANVMAQILETSASLPIIPGDHYRFIGIEITRPVNGKPYTALVRTETSKVIFDRCWIHGDALDDTAHLVQIGPGSDHIAVVDSYLNDAHCSTTGECIDSQAVGDHDGGFAIKVVNNFLEAASENMLFGGGAATSVTSDVEIRLNHVFKPMSWNPADPSFLGTRFIVKNNLEFKEGQRVLVEGNYFQNTWGGFSQKGRSIELGAKNQEGRDDTNLCPICFTADLTIRYNYVTHGAGGIGIGDGATQNGAWAAGAHDFSIHDVIFDGMQYAECYGCGNFLTEIGSGYSPTSPPPSTLNNVSMNHLTVVNVGFLGGHNTATGLMEMSGPPANNPTNTPQITNLSWTNSIIDAGNSGAYPMGGGTSNCSVGEKTVAAKIVACWTGASSFAGNVLVTDYASSPFTFPPGNHTPATWDAVGFVNFNGGDGGNYQLSSTSPYKGLATDGSDPGADVNGVMSPVPAIQ
jgi:hypothetical protein